MIPTYGIPELTGWIPCSDCTDYSNERVHPSGELLYKNSPVRAIARSLLRYKYRWKIDDKRTGRMSKHVYSTTIVLSPKITMPAENNDLKLHVKLDNDISVVYPELALFEEVSNIGCEYTLLKLQETLFSTSTNLTVTISNSGVVSTGLR